MKVRFYCDIPSHGVRLEGANQWALYASTNPSSVVLQQFVRVAFDVDMPTNLVLPPQDVMAPDTSAKVVTTA